MPVATSARLLEGAWPSPQGDRSLPLQTVESTRLYRQIADQIAASIARGEYRAGARLPPERELAALLGVSRTSVREAIICLELAGQVEVRVGTGLFVAARKPEAPTGSRSPAAKPGADAGPGPFDLLTARRLIEGEIVALAAKTIRRSEIAKLRETIRRMREHAADFVLRDAADRAFHVGIAEATRNSALAAVVDQMWDQRRGALWTRIEGHFHTVELRGKTLNDHVAILGALEARDPEASRAAMCRHLQRVAREFQRRWDELGDVRTEAVSNPAAVAPCQPPPGPGGRRSDPPRRGTRHRLSHP
jgi:GntR family uxuAB operon transcriptional repressor